MMHRIKHHVVHHAHRAKHHLRNAFVPHPGNNHRPHALRHKALTGYALAVIAVKVVISGLLIAFPGPSATSNLTPTNIVQLTNKERAAGKLKALRSNATLASAAQSKGQDMLAKGYFAHISPTKVTPWYWFKKAGYSYSSAGENLAMDFITAEDVTAAWMASPGHRKNIMNAKFVDIGVAVVSGKLKGVSTTIVVQFFAVPTAVKQQPKPAVNKVTPPQPPSQKVTSTVQKTAEAVKPVTPVLGEDIVVPPPPPPAPLQPKLTSPSADDVLATARPWIGGEAETETKIFIYYDGNSIGESASDGQGYFRLQPSQDIPDGLHVITAVASTAAGTSTPSEGLKLTIDTKPPSASLTSVTVLPSLHNPNGYTVAGVVTGDDIASARIRIGSASVPLPSTSGHFSVEVAPNIGNDVSDITAELTDTVGNISVVPVAALAFLDVNILQPETRGFLAFLQNMVFYSRRFFITLWMFVFLALAVNILVRIRIQHRATVLYSLLLLYGLTIVMITS